MKVVLQCVNESSVKVNKKMVSKINKGYMALVSFTLSDTKDVIDKMVDKIVNLRVFEDENGKMNLSILDINGEILSISQFTLYASLKGQRRPSFVKALNYKDAKNLYEYFNIKLRGYNINVEEGIFGEDMKVSLINDGPKTFIIDSEEDIWKTK